MARSSASPRGFSFKNAGQRLRVDQACVRLERMKSESATSRHSRNQTVRPDLDSFSGDTAPPIEQGEIAPTGIDPAG